MAEKGRMALFLSFEFRVLNLFRISCFAIRVCVSLVCEGSLYSFYVYHIMAAWGVKGKNRLVHVSPRDAKPLQKDSYERFLTVFDAA